MLIQVQIHVLHGKKSLISLNNRICYNFIYRERGDIMKVAIISTFDTFFDRVDLLKEYYQGKGLEVTVITSDYSHRLKEKYQNDKADIQLSVRPYNKNLSIDRLRSHDEFAKKVKEYLETLRPEIVHCIIPCNSLCKTMSAYKKEHDVKLIFDVNDLWPESLPVGNIKHRFPFTLWKNTRDKYIEHADMILSECDYFKEILHKEHSSKWHTLHFAKKMHPSNTVSTFTVEKFSFCYLGSINNIIDIDLIVAFLNACTKLRKVKLHIIGGGEKKELLIEQVKQNSIQVIDHGYIFEQEKKQEILDQCQYGFNVMKDSVMVGLTMKSMDYMCGGLPMINTIKGDTAKICDEYSVGYNLTKDSISEIVSLLEKETIDENRQKRETIKKVFMENFSQEAFNKTLERLEIV